MKRILFALALAATCGAGARGADRYWDVNGPAAGAGGPTPSGAWSTAGTTWNTDSSGVASPGAWVAQDVAIFSAGADATGAYNVSISSSIGDTSRSTSGITVEDGAPNFTGNGQIVVTAGPIVVYSGAALSINSSSRINTTAGSTVTLNGGTLQTTNPSDGGTFFDTDAEIIMGVGGGTLSNATANNLSIVQTASRISGAGSLTKAGVGVIAINGAAGNNTYSGGTIVDNGELRISGVNNTLPIDTTMTVNSPGIFNLNGGSQQIASLTGTGDVGTAAGTLTISGSASTTFAGALRNVANSGAGGTSGNGRLVKSGIGVITFNGLNDITGSVTLEAGGITVGATGSLAGDVADLTVSGGTLTLNNAAEKVRNLAGAGGTISLGSGHVLTTDPQASTTYSGAISGAGGLVKANALVQFVRRTLTLSGNNDYGGNTVVTGGLISIAHANALGSTAGYTEVNATSALGAEVLFTGVGGSVTSSEPFRLAGGGSSNGGAISVTAGATATISGPVTLIGDTTLSVSGTSGVIYDNANAITSAANQNLTLQGDALSTGAGGTISGAISLGTGSLTKAEGGSWKLSAPAGNSYSGGTIINGGTVYANNASGSATGSGDVTVNGGALAGSGIVAGAVTINSGGALSPGMSIDSLDVGALTFEDTGANPTFVFEINSAAMTADLVNAAGLTFNGAATLAFSDVAGTPVSLGGTKFTLIAYNGALSGLGTFAGLNQSDYITGIGANDWQINYADNTPGVNGGVGTSFVTIVAAVPEASSLLFGGLAFCAAQVVAGVCWVRRRKS